MSDFRCSQADLQQALKRLSGERPAKADVARLRAAEIFPDAGLGQTIAAGETAALTLDQAQDFAAEGWFAHMDPPTPWVTWAAQAWTAAMNQNLLHPDTGSVGKEIEAKVVDALAPHFGMDGGHMVPGSTLANLTALWAAREIAGVDEVVASELAHLSVAKAAHILLTGRDPPYNRTQDSNRPSEPLLSY